MRRYLIFGLIFLLSGGGLSWYFWFRDQDKDLLWRFVPADALWVYEHPRLGALWEKKLEGHPIQPFLEAFYTFTLQRKGNTFWARWQQNKEVLREVVEDLPIKLSGHDLEEGRMGFIFYAQLSETKREALRRLFSSLTRGGFTTRSRMYRGYTLHEISTEDGAQHFAYLIGAQYFMGTFSPFLLEDVVRAATGASRMPYFEFRRHVRKLNPTDEQAGRLYLSLGPATAYWKSLWGTASNPDLFLSRYMGADAMLEAYFLPSHLSWSGFVAAADSSQQRLLSGFSENLPPTLPYLHMVPNRCALLQRYAFAQAETWNLQMQSLWEHQNNTVLGKRLALFSHYGVDIDKLFRYVGHMGAVLNMEAPPGVAAERLFLLHIKKTNAIKQSLNEINKRLGPTSGDYREQHQDHSIYYLELKELPYLLFGEHFAGFSELFYTLRGDFLLASSSLLTLKATLDQLEEEESWGRTPAWQSQISEEIQDAHFSVQVNLSKYWNTLRRELRYPWYLFFQEYQIEAHEPCFLSLQLRRLEDKLYTQVQLHAPVLRHKQAHDLPLAAQPEPKSEEIASAPISVDEIPTAYVEEAARSFRTPLMSKPLLLFNPSRRRFETFVQEKGSFLLHALDPSGASRWQTPLEERIISPVYPIDYFKNGRTQYLFATVSAVYVLTKRGNPLPGFPVSLPTSDSIAFLNLVDYDKTRNYRFFVSDLRGRAYILNKEGKPLPGWNPNTLAKLSQAPFHLRVGNRDCMILPQADGFLQMYKRIGSPYPGFPVRIGRAFGGNLYIEKGTTLGRSYFVLLNAAGERLRLSFTGEVTDRQPIYPALNNAQYRLVPGVLNNSYVCVAANRERLVVVDAQGQVLFEKANFLSENFHVQYYDLGPQQELLVFQDKTRGQAYFYDLNGAEALPSPLPTSEKIALSYSRSTNSYTIHLTQKDKYLRLNYKK